MHVHWTRTRQPGSPSSSYRPIDFCACPLDTDTSAEIPFKLLSPGGPKGRQTAVPPFAKFHTWSHLDAYDVAQSGGSLPFANKAHPSTHATDDEVSIDQLLGNLRLSSNPKDIAEYLHNDGMVEISLGVSLLLLITQVKLVRQVPMPAHVCRRFEFDKLDQFRDWEYGNALQRCASRDAFVCLSSFWENIIFCPMWTGP